MGDKRDPQNKNEIYARSVRCPVHHAVIGKYDMRDGLINAVYLCPKCRREYTYTIPPRKT